MQHPASPVGVNISSSIYINLTHTCCTLCTLVYLKVPSLDAGDSKQSWNSTPNPLSPQKGSLVNLSDTLYAMSSMDLRSRYIRKFGRVPLHLNYKLLGWNWGESIGTQRGQMKGVLSWLVRWACRAGTRDFCSALAALVGRVKKNFSS
jgi:hypothetical protein